MTDRTLTVAQARKVDRVAIDECGMSGLVLMENAARGCADIALEIAGPGPVAVFCGKGNNGGDGLAMARHLDNAGREVRVFVFANPGDLSPDAAANLRLLKWTGVEVHTDVEQPPDLTGCGLVVDALLGTGGGGAPRPPLDWAVAAANAGGLRVLSLDAPSGLNCDDGSAPGACARADVTATFVAPKAGFAAPSARLLLGEVRVVDIGVPRGVLSRIFWDESASGAAGSAVELAAPA